MRSITIKLNTIILLAMSLTVMANAQTTYWLGIKDGDKLSFNVQIPADAAAAIMHKTKAPDGGANTTPRYKSTTKDGVVVHENEIAWETPKLDDGGLTWVTEAGVGEEWKECDPQNPLWAGFAEALRNIATPYANGWSQAKVVMIERKGNAPNVELKLDSNAGKNTAANQKTAQNVPVAAPGSNRCANVETPLSEAEIAEILRVHNEVRAEVGTAPLKWNCALAKIAQEWAEKDIWEHRKNLDKIIPGTWAGENLSTDANSTTTIAQLIQGWIDEKAHWNNDAKTCETGKECGHYTQMVWKSTTEVGCGINRKSSTMGDEWKGQASYLVCNYSPGGNDGGAAW